MMLSMLAVCPDTQYINKSGKEWNEFDGNVINRNIHFCTRKYPNKPCITKFIKLADRTYYIECGEKRGK